MTVGELTELAARSESGSGEDWTLCKSVYDALGRDDWRADLAVSVDVVAQLIVDCFPMVKWCVGYSPHRKKAWAWLESEDHPTATDGPTASRALLSSLLRALAAQQQDRPAGENDGL